VVVPESRLKDLYRLWAWGPWRWSLEHAPPTWELRAIRALGESVARASPASRARVLEGLRRAFPGRDDLDAVAVQAFGAHFCNQYASFAFHRVTAATLDRYVNAVGVDHLDASRSVGAVLMHPHTGPAQLALCALGVLGYPVHQVGGGVVAVQHSRVGRWAARTRTRLEGRLPATLHDASAYARPLLRALSSGAVVLTACDGTGGGREIGRRLVRDVLGQPMQVPVGAFYLALRSGAALHTLWVHRDPATPGRHVVEIGPEVQVRREAPLEEVLEAGADFTAAWLSEVLARDPGEWIAWDQFRPGGLLVGGPRVGEDACA
jgi:lauroyl/myristoyl acyltransferase